MKFIKKLDDNLYLLYINLKTNSKRQKLINNGRFLTVHVRSKPVKNKANKELIFLLKNRLKISSNQIQIINGMKSKNKRIQIHFLEEQGAQLLIDRLFNQ